MIKNRMDEIKMSLEIIRYFSAKKRIGERINIGFHQILNEKLEFIKSELEEFMKYRGIDYLLLSELIELNIRYKDEKNFYEKLEALIEDLKEYVDNNQTDLIDFIAGDNSKILDD